MSCCAGPLPVELAEHAARQTDILRFEEVKQQAKTLADGSLMLRLNVPEVHCAACISKIENKLTKITNVTTARVNLSLRQLTVTVVDLNAVKDVLKSLDELGYRYHVAGEIADADPELRGLLRALAVAGFAATNIMLLSISVWNGAEPSTRELFHFISALIAVPAVAYAGQPFFKSAVRALNHRRMNMDVPISLGVLLATGMSLYESVIGGGHAYFDAATSLLFFLLIGRALDLTMRGRARQLVTRMSQLANKGGVRILEQGNMAYVPQGEIVPGMLLRVAAGERLVVDAEVVSGRSSVDRSLVTGESAALTVEPGSKLEAGVLNLSGVLDVKALRTADKSFLGEVTQMLAAAEQGRGDYVRLADRMARIYSPAVHVLALLTFIGWMFATRGDWHQALTVAVAVLIITCPCALGLAVPVAHVVAASSLFKRGVLVKDGSALERLADIDYAAFDKTGTLTDSNLKVDQCFIPTGDEEHIAKSLALTSSHPAARSLAQHFKDTATLDLTNIKELPGYGVEGQFKGKTYRLGRSSWVSNPTEDKFSNVSGLAFGCDGGASYAVSFREVLREGAVAMSQELARRHISTEIISGDREDAVTAVADRLGIAQRTASMTPATKYARLETLAAQGHKVLMVGDGLNDAPALAAAHVSIAPSSASDIGRTAADFVFLGESLSAVTDAHHIARRAKRIVQQNFALAAAYNALAVPLAMSGYLNPLLAAIAMSTSSLLVVGNSLRLSESRLLNWKQEPVRQPTLLESAA